MIVSRRRVFALGAAALAVTLPVAALLYRSAHGSPPPAAAAVSGSASSLQVIWSHDETWPRPLQTALRRGALHLTELRGYPVVLNFFASWCDACRREASLLRAAARRVQARVVFVGVDVNDYTPAARAFLRAHRVPYAAVRSTSATAGAFRLIGLPETFYLDRTGRVTNVTRGEVTAGELALALRRLTGR